MRRCSTSTTGPTTSSPRSSRTSRSEYGIHVNYDVFDSNEILETKLLTGHTNYDMVVPSGAFLRAADQADIYQKLDKALLPNLKNVDPDSGRATGGLRSRATSTASTTCGSPPGSATTPPKIRERMPDAPVDCWRMIFDPAVVSKFAGLRRFDPGRAVGGGGHGAAVSRQESQQQLARGSEGRGEGAAWPCAPTSATCDSSRYIDNLANGDICLAMGWSGDVKQAHDRAQEAGKGIDLAYSIPQRGRDRATSTCWRSRPMRRT